MHLKKVAIIGSRGYIGSELSKFFENKFDLTLVSSKSSNNKIENQNFLTKVILANDYIIFLSNINSIKENEEYPLKNYKVSISPLKKICHISNKLKKKINILYFSSSSVYGIQNGSINENAITKPTCNYDFQKLLCEEILKEAKSQYLKYTILRLGNIYGPSEKNPQSKDRGIVGKIIKSAIVNNKIYIYGSGDYCRNYLYIKDLVELIFLIIKKNKFKNQIYNVGSNEFTTLKKIFSLISKIVSEKMMAKVKIIYKKWPEKHFKIEKRNFKLSCAKLRKEIDWKSTTTILRGINSYINYYLKELK